MSKKTIIMNEYDESNWLNEIRFLGYDNNTLASYIYSDLTKAITKINVDKFNRQILALLLNSKTLKTLELLSLVISDEDIDRANILNYTDIVNKYRKAMKEVESTIVEGKSTSITKACLYLQKIIISCGVLNVDDVNGSGVYIHDGELLINSGDVYTIGKSKEARKNPSRVFLNGVGGKVVYEYTDDLGFSNKTEEIGDSGLSNIFEAVRSFSFTKQQDVDLFLGWLCHAYFAGALPWRTHLSITGARGSGKSLLLSFASNLLGKFGIKAEGDSTESGIRQKVKKSAKAVMLDESEADGKKIARNLNMFRSASSGGVVLRGTSDQSGLEYQLKIAGCIAGIVPPIFNAADASRFLQITMERAKGQALNPLLDENNSDNVNRLGLSLFTLLAKNYFHICEIQKDVKSIMMAQGRDGRFIATNSYIVAFAYFLRKCVDHSLDFIEYVNEFDFTDQLVLNEAKDEDDLLDVVVSQFLTTQGGSKDTILGWVSYYNNTANDAQAQELVRSLFLMYGMKIHHNDGDVILRVDTGDFNFKNLLGSLGKSDVKKVLLRCDHVKLMETTAKNGRTKFFASDKNRNAANVIEVNLSKAFFDEVKEEEKKPQEKHKYAPRVTYFDSDIPF